MGTANRLPSASSTGKSWLAQFDENDQDTARLLMDSILYVDHNTFQQGLEELIHEAAEEDAHPIGLYSAREQGKAEPYQYFTNKVLRPLIVDARRPLGSEGTVAHIIGRSARKSSKLLDHPSLSTLKRAKVHTIAFVDDIVASGTRIAKFWRRFTSHASMKSRWSYHRYRLVVVCFASSAVGEDAIREAIGIRRHDVQIRSVMPARNGSAVWDAKDLKRIKKLCLDYGPRTNAKPYYYCGYKDGLFSTVFAHGCPNNAPAILWKKSRHWQPLFPERVVPSELLVEGSRRPPQTVHAVFSSNDDTSGIDLEGKTGAQLLRILQAAAEGSARRPAQFALRVGISLRSTRRLLQISHQLGLTDQHGSLTTAGKRELRRKKALERQPPQGHNIEAFYFKR